MWLRGGACLRLFRTFFLAAPSPLSLLKLTFISISSGWFVLFFLFFLGDAGGTAAAGVFGVAVEVLGDGGSGAATADGGAFVFEEGMRLNFFPLFRGLLPLSGHFCPALLVI